jgi:LDH2 family malate/lactate/ureidoglycolate dehydrogenase
MIASNASPWVAPHGATEGRFGTNPICFRLPQRGRARHLGHRHVRHHPRRSDAASPLGTPLPGASPSIRRASPTLDPVAALAGAFAPWGGHKGSGLAIVVHLLGMLAGRR